MNTETMERARMAMLNHLKAGCTSCQLAMQRQDIYGGCRFGRKLVKVYREGQEAGEIRTS